MHPRIVFLDVDSHERSRVEAAHSDARFLDADADLAKECPDVQILSVFVNTKLTADVIAALPDLRLVCTRSVGFDHIDLGACKERGITVCNVPDYGSHVIAEHVFALLLGTLRHITEGNRRVNEGVFDYHGLKGMALNGKTIGIVGTGKIGRKVAQFAHGFDMRILAQDICIVEELKTKFGVTYVEREQLFRESDIISLHAPSLPQTKGMINAEAVAQMKDGVIIVNTARGSLIDSQALLDGLESGKVAWALLDVLENESLGGEVDKALTRHPRVITTPHIAFYADDSVRTMYVDCLESIRTWLNGERPLHVVQELHVTCDIPNG
jgi:D-lactate dehydrogenase